MPAADRPLDTTRRRRPSVVGRQGMTLIEILVVIAIMGIIALISIPSIGSLLELQQRSAVKEIGLTATWLLDEAALRNATFRFVFDLDHGTWKVEVGDASSVVFSTPEERAEFDKELEDRMSRFTQREIEEGAAQEVLDQAGRFEGLSDPSFSTQQTLPDDCRFAWVWTPQYGEDGVTPSKEILDGGELDEDEEPATAYSYIFSDGTAELTVIRIVDKDDEEDGWTLVIEPLSGRVRLEPDIVDPEDAMAWLPQEGPSIQ